jgi:hypothetical protein
MHDTSCLLRPGYGGVIAPVVGSSDPNYARCDPFRPLVALHAETLAFDITVNATSEEGVVSRLIYGPFRLDEIAFRSSASGGASQQLRFCVGDQNVAPTTVVGVESGVPAQVSTDAARTIGTYYATNVYERHALAQFFRTGTARLIFMMNNTTAGAITIVGHVTLTHCREATCDEIAAYG